MAEMAATPEIEHVFADLAALTGMVNSGEAGLPAIQRLVELAQRAVDSAGATFIEYGPVGGRVIAASGAARWAVGRYIDPADHLVDEEHPEQVVDARVEDIPTALGRQLCERGVRRVLAGQIEGSGPPGGMLRADPPRDTPARRGRRAGAALVRAGARALLPGPRRAPGF